MSNKPKGVAIHPNNDISPIERTYNACIRHALNWARKHFGYGKHVGSKPLRVIHQYKDE